MKKTGVIGAGTMGSGIAQVAAMGGCEVVLWDANTEFLQKAFEKLKTTLHQLVEKGKITEDQRLGIQTRLKIGTGIQDFAGCDLVIEAIVENRDIKAGVFRDLENVVGDDCILATNTSSLSIASLAAACRRPERFLGIHFFNPAPVMALVEIVPAVQTSEAVLSEATREIKSWGKITVQAKDTPGFIVNRVARPFYGEALRIYDEGIADMATIDHAMKTLGGFRMGPFELMDFIGNDINYTVTETVFQSFFCDPRYTPSFTQKRMMEAGYLGRKTGRGFYHYDDQASKPEPNQDPRIHQQIFNRILVMLINEAADAVLYGIASEADVDLAMTKAVNYPKGLLQWGKEMGFAQVVAQLDELFGFYHEPRYRASAWLRRNS